MITRIDSIDIKFTSNTFGMITRSNTPANSGATTTHRRLTAKLYDLRVLMGTSERE